MPCLHDLEHGIMPFAIKNLLDGERFWGGGQPCGLATAKTSLSIQKILDCKWY
jgi:hypothetical protein